MSPGLFEYIDGFLGSMSHIAETLVFVISGVLVTRRVGNTFEGKDYGRAVALWAMSQVRLPFVTTRREELYVFAPMPGVVFDELWGCTVALCECTPHVLIYSALPHGRVFDWLCLSFWHQSCAELGTGLALAVR